MICTKELSSSGNCYRIIDLSREAGENLVKMPWILRILLENVLRKNEDAASIAATKTALADWLLKLP